MEPDEKLQNDTNSTDTQNEQLKPAQDVQTQPVTHTEVVNQNEVTSQSFSADSAKPTLNNESIKKKIWLRVVLLLLLLAAGAAAAYVLIGQNENPKNNTSVTQADRAIERLTIGSTQTPFSNMYPAPGFLFGSSIIVNLQVYEGLIGYENGEKFVPLLAESWINPNENTWVFTLKKNVKFHDGSLMRAEDVKRSIEFAMNNEDIISLTENIASVEVSGEDKITITTKEPDAILLNKLPLVFIQGENKMNGVAVGTGAYKPTAETDISETSVKLAAFDDYHQGKPSVRSIEYKAYDSEELLVDAVKSGNVDITDFLRFTPEESPNVEGYSKVLKDMGDVTYIGINTLNNAPIGKKPVREALRLSIDPNVFLAESKRPGRVASQLSVRQNIGYNPDIKPVARDVEKAKSLLKSAGYPNGVTIDFQVAPNPSNLLAYETLKRQAADAGIKFKDVQVSDDSEYGENVFTGKVQTYFITQSSSLLDSYDLFSFTFRGITFLNEEFENLVKLSTKEFDPEKREELLQGASKILIDEVALIPLIENDNIYYHRSNLDIRIDPTGYAAGGYIYCIREK